MLAMLSARRAMEARSQSTSTPLGAMTMKALVRHALWRLGLAIALTTGGTASAAVIVNGDFSDGLDNWAVTAVTDPIVPYTVSILDGTATIDQTGETVASVSDGVSGRIATISQSDDFSVSEIDLYQVFTLPDSPQSLQFTLGVSRLDSSGSYPPPGFGASLLDPSTLQASSGVATVDSATDSFYLHGLTTDDATSQATSAVRITPLSSTSEQVSLDLSALSGGGSAEILFRLLEGGDTSAAVSISDVKLLYGSPGGGGGGTPVVPEPGTFGMFFAGAACLFWAKRRRTA